ncbi:tryptophan 7-halogenase [Microbulbifer salipaludis]|uniref:Tryptophan 7-halogenase n=1 Tax=Microbulbifer salipaludis TaxID=187980 RepID=A0ABS3E6R2_9GAMM|nr:tryptophan halogenase family protein [Microbulbifer salipaludis]MBN8431001.1 tryptophan 7-halogenase [Microbulbifer salipaludis]
MKKIIILGGGTAGWMTAAAMARLLVPSGIEVTLVESDQIGTVGVGEATLPHLRFFNQILGIDENAFMKATQATYKMGIEFQNWGRPGDAYIHPFGEYGRELDGIPFHQLWLKAHRAGIAEPLDHYSLPVMAAAAGKFDFPDGNPRSILSTYSYAFHLDAGLYARYLREFAEQLGIQRIEGRVSAVVHDEYGDLHTLVLQDGNRISADFFVDCSGFRSLLLGDALQTEFIDWSHWLPCDSAVAVPSDMTDAPLPYTKAIAHGSGWQWQIPLQHRMGNGLVYAREYMSDDQACQHLLDNLPGAATDAPRLLRFKAGRRKHSWQRNCLAVGLSAGFLEPLESTSIYLIQIAITKFLALLPLTDNYRSCRNEFNRQMALEYDRIRDFLVLHYHATERDDTPFWNYCRTMPIPDDLQRKMDLYRQQGHIVNYRHGLFLEPSWLAVYHGQRILPDNHSIQADHLANKEIGQLLSGYSQLVHKGVAALPAHADVIARQLSARPRQAPSAAMSLYRGAEQ